MHSHFSGMPCIQKDPYISHFFTPNFYQMKKSLVLIVDLMLAGDTYVNVHTSQYPGGEIRGQIRGNTPGDGW